ncbi:hypothetical protein KFE25_005263 [Diacronema lutheri]|nr:hypothetical protein KFE25_005263 [Diacronema lutheri]
MARAHDEHAHEGPEDDVVEVDSTNYADVVLSNPYAWLVEFSSKHCQSCKEFAPRWHELTHEFEAELLFAHVSVDSAEGKALAKELGTLREGIPNLKLVVSADAQPHPIFAGEHAHKIAPSLRAALNLLGRDAEGRALKRGAAAPKGEL